LRLLFVGRLEGRKGIDVLLTAAKRVLVTHPHVYLDIVGDDTIPGPGGRTWRLIFEENTEANLIRTRIAFHGVVTDAFLRGLYHACDVVVTPSRFESFGLMLVEGMMFGKPVIGCRAGGMLEVVEDGKTGLLAEPGDVASLEACLNRLIEDPELRARLGKAARARYEKYFTAERMTAEVVAFLSHVGNSWSDRLRPMAVAAGIL
jgi:glycosyltransferase involved in cell wall biosynthesis